ncbi:xaa-Pro aminopeptidase 1-like isoform X1 [Temnothorax curvispinosus]|uniref:Xaa-Pro aminopeptidase 1-like isoform X1 n=1 Tax=Temnothorax curvispinosus TaxID=300111 RepID=A0A6J1PQE6_9HYME|nr:xaa-Pro aminopeptidase 1-like isoform X1 [Temnothorax curvispinosus]
MKKFVFRILLTSCILGLTKADISTLPKPEHNYNGAERLYCPVNAYAENQPVNRHDSSLRLRQLRSEMVRVAAVQGPPLDGYIVTSDDEHQTVSFVSHGRDGPLESEAVDPHDMRREFLTGFYGSAGEAIVTIDKAVLWTDGRYHIQANHQLDCNWILMKRGERDVPTITEWLIQEFENRSEVRIGANPKLIPAFTWEIWEDELANSPVRLVGVRNDLVDLIWQVGRPEYNPHAAYPLADGYSGKPWQEKVRSIRLEMELTSADALVVTALDEIAWLFNVRGYDLPHTPVLRAYAIVAHGDLHLYAPRHKILRSVDIHLKVDSCSHANCVKWHNYTDIWYDLKTMSQVWNTVWLPSPCGYSPGASKEIYNSIPPEKRLAKASPIIDLRAKKNKVEAAGMRSSHLRDAIAMCDFLAYMEEQYKFDSEGWDEMQVARVINEIRYEQGGNRGIAFPTIAGYGPHAAMPHYEPNNLTNIKIGTTSTLMIDSGGQYLDGTTDVTRTLHFGVPTDEQRKAYTRVLIGSIELSSLIFPSDLTVDQLDAVARRPLWSTGYDYMHGTGHGIGHFSSVHEPPISLSYFGYKNSIAGCSVKLKPGFFLSNEPGYYKENDFGVRLENVLEVIPADKLAHNGRRFLKFRDVTLVPYEPKLIDVNMLTPLHRRWLNNYNKRIREEVGAELKKNLKMKAFYWMMVKTTSIPETGSGGHFFPDYSQAIPSTSRQFHVLVVIVAIYHVVASKRYSNNLCFRIRFNR